MDCPIPDSECFSEAETERRREAALKRMLATPHKPHAPQKTPKGGETQKRKR